MLSDIVDYFSSSFEAEVDVEVREGDTFRVQESFEKKVIFYRVYICNRSSVGYKRTSS